MKFDVGELNNMLSPRAERRRKIKTPRKGNGQKLIWQRSMKKRKLQATRAIQQLHQDFMPAAKRCRELLEEIRWYWPTGEKGPVQDGWRSIAEELVRGKED
jgi:hypothetical protein